MKEVNPPAIVRSENEEKTFADLVNQGVVVHGEMRKGEKLNLERAVELGKILEEMYCKRTHGNWLEGLAKIGISHQRAGEFMELPKVPAPALLKMRSIREAFDYIAKQKLQPNQQPSQAVATFDPVKNYCSRDCRVGKGPTNCEKCAKLNRPVPTEPRIEQSDNLDQDTDLSEPEPEKTEQPEIEREDIPATGPAAPARQPRVLTVKETLEDTNKIIGKLARRLDDLGIKDCHDLLQQIKERLSKVKP